MSTRPENSIGSDEDWNLTESGLKLAFEQMNLSYVINEGDGAFYGSKIDFHLKDSIGRTWQCGTIQLDFQLPFRFQAEYTGADNRKHRPVMIHRVVFCSRERFIGILIEHYAGEFPLWLSSVQVKILLISERFIDYALEVKAELEISGFRCEVDNRDEELGFKIREAQLDKVPFIVIIDEKEANKNLLSIRKRDEGDLGEMSLKVFVKMLETCE